LLFPRCSVQVLNEFPVGRDGKHLAQGGNGS
jgi:hypothetical protein